MRKPGFVCASKLSIGCALGYAALAGFNSPPNGAQGQVRAQANRGALWDQMARGPHTGSLQDALVAVEVTASASDGAVKRVSRGNGLMLRCDGFVLVPTALFNTTLEVAGSKEEASALQIAVLVRPGLAGERRLVARRPRFEKAGLGFTVAKIDNWHGPALITETPGYLPKDEPVAVYWSDWDAAAQRWSPVRSIASKLGPHPTDSDNKRPGRRPFDAALGKVPAGALVLGASGRALGIVVSSTADSGTEEFVGFDALGLATNCVVPEAPRLPDAGGTTENRNPGPGAGAPDGQAGGSVARVPGGPVTLPASVVQMQPDLEGARFACVPPFEIDKFEVTNRQYFAFWEGLPEARKSELWFQSQYYPAGWSKRGLPFPEEVADMPVIGVPRPGAEAFARSQGKRLPTPYEWCLAAFGSDGGAQTPTWVADFIRDRLSTWEKACGLHIEYRQTNLALVRSQNSRHPDLYQIPWVASLTEMMEASAWSKRTLLQLTDPLRRQYRNPDYLEPVGAREVDDSPFGARDMLLNAAELVVTHPGPPARGNDRFMVSEFLPFRFPQDAQFVPRNIELIGAREENPPYPHLSRLFRRLINGPSTADLVAWSNVAELQRVLTPVGGWEIRMSALPQTGYMGRPPGRGLAALGRAPALKLWEGVSPHFRLETGIPIPFDITDRRIPTGPSLFYLPVTGFRCVKAQ